MKKTIITLFLSIISMSLYAQADNDYIEVVRSLLKTEKKAVITEVMELTEAESAPFWELYNEYEFELNSVQNIRLNAIKEYAEEYGILTDDKADKIMNEVLDFKTASLKLEKKYYKKFKKILPTAKAAKYFQAENKIQAMVAASIAEEIPMIIED